MNTIRCILSVALFLIPVSPLQAPTADAATGTAIPTGHWEGTIQAPDREVKIEVDLTKDSQGSPRGTFSNPAQGIQRYPLSSVVVENRSIRMVLQASGGGTFDGALSDDGRSMSGEFQITTPEGDMALPFRLTRTGDAKLDAPSRNKPVARTFEGTWLGALEVEGKIMRVQLELRNRPDTTSAATVTNLDQGGVEIPVSTIVQKDSTLALDLKMVAGSYAGTMNKAGSELVGTWTQGSIALPLTFRRAPEASQPKKPG